MDLARGEAEAVAVVGTGRDRERVRERGVGRLGQEIEGRAQIAQGASLLLEPSSLLMDGGRETMRGGIRYWIGFSEAERTCQAASSVQVALPLLAPFSLNRLPVFSLSDGGRSPRRGGCSEGRREFLLVEGEILGRAWTWRGVA
jgi:hypothetical protein